MTKEELLKTLSILPDNAEVLVSLEDRYAEIRNVRAEYSQRVDERKPYIIISIYK